MRRLYVISMVVFAAQVVASVGSWFGISTAAPPQPSQASERQVSVTSAREQAANETILAVANRYVGAGGCAAAACHGDATAAKSPSWKSSYSRWLNERDPHSFAYAVLKSDPSKRIVWLLDGGRPDPQAEKDKPWSNSTPHRDSRCLTCHSITPDAQTELHENLLADGVSCEACHGPAASWVASHTTARWLDVGAQRYQNIGRHARDDAPPHSTNEADLRMWNTKALVSRANICVGCHVGGPDRDVNHDLIAAGHPRLNFEYHAFMQNLPKHWDDERDREQLVDDPTSAAKKPPDYEARLWAVGQVVGAQAATTLLHQRAERSTAQQTLSSPEESSSPGKWRHETVRPAWPELAEFSCYACHHGLKATPVNAAGDRKPTRSLGSLSWGAWHFSEVQRRLLLQDEKLSPLRDTADAVRKVMESPTAHVKEVASLIEKSEGSLSAANAHHTQISTPEIDRWLGEFAKLPRPESWDEATQRYLALNALAKSHKKMIGAAAGIDYHAVDRRLEEIRRGLQFQPGYFSPGRLSLDELSRFHKSLLDVAVRLAP